jgi:hypothetical protein
MNDQAIHRHYLHFQELPLSVRFVYTGALLVLGTGYMFAAIYLFAAHSGRDGNPASLSVQDVIITYQGSKEGTRLESALLGPMSGMLPAAEIEQIISWIHSGADKGGYDQQIVPIVEKSCLSCHGGSNPHLARLDGYDNFKKVVERDTGTDLFTLVRVSHIHLFGLTFIFFLMGLIFSHAFVRPVWLKCLIVGTPFIGIAVDVSSWYVTKFFSAFAWGVMLSGAIMALCFTIMWCISMYQMWFYKVPERVASRPSGAPQVLG